VLCVLSGFRGGTSRSLTVAAMKVGWTKRMICSVSFGAHAGNWKVRVTLLPFRVRAHAVPRGRGSLAVPRIADHSGRTIDIYPNSHAKMSQIASSMALQRQLARSGTQFAKTSIPRVQSRNLQDIAITRTGKPIIRISGGRYDSPAKRACPSFTDSARH